MSRPNRSAFTLVEILIVVVILGIMAAIVIPSLAGAVQDSAVTATYTDLQKLRRAVGVYQSRWHVLPPVEEGDAANILDRTGPWGPLVGQGEDTRADQYFLNPPTNAYIGGTNGRVVVLGEAPDAEFHADYGWIFNPETGEIFAASFNAQDQPIPR